MPKNNAWGTLNKHLASTLLKTYTHTPFLFFDDPSVAYENMGLPIIGRLDYFPYLVKTHWVLC